MLIRSFQDLLAYARQRPKAKLSVAAAYDREVLQGVKLAVEEGVAEPILLGEKPGIEKILAEIGLPLNQVEIIHHEDPVEAARAAVKLVHDGQAQTVMKGMVDSGNFMRAVLDEKIGLRTGRILSHLAAFDVPGQNRLLFVTDGGINIAPNLQQKMAILTNAVPIMRALGIEVPKVAALAAVEVVNSKMPATVDAGEIVKQSEAGAFPGVEVAGPYALDVAVDVHAAAHKHVRGPVAGQADLLLMPNIETGNIFSKSLSYFAGGTMAGIVVGPQVPVVLTSRNDPPRSKLASIALALVARD